MIERDWLVSADADYDALTPVMRQLIDAKRLHPGAIVFFRLGDFYELFFEDALEAAPLLDMVLTSRNKNDARPIPMCGFPHHAMSGYLQKLLELSRSVAVVEQLEDPKFAKGCVKRGVTRVITPGVVLETEALDGKRANHLVALVPRRGGGLGVAVAEVSTGDLRVAEVAHAAGLATLLVRLEPREILLPEVVRPWLEAAAGGREPLWSVRPVPPAVQKAHRDDAAGCAAGYLREYLAEVRPASLGLLGQPAPLNALTHLRLDREAVGHLELLETSRHGRRAGALLAAVDRTCTAGGARALRGLLLAPLADRDDLRARHGAVEALLGGARDEVRSLLTGSADLARMVGRAAVGLVTPRELVAARTTLLRLPDLAAALAPLGPVAPRLANLVAAFDEGAEIAAQLCAVLADEPHNQLSDGGVIRPGVNGALDDLIELCDHSTGWLERFTLQQRELLGIATTKVRFNRVAGYGIEVSRARSHVVPEHYRRVQTLKHVERYTTPELSDFEQRLLTARDQRVALESQIFLQLTAWLSDRSGALRRIAAALAEIDVHASFAAVAVTHHYCRPELRPDHDPVRLELLACRHPVVEQMLESRAFVPNDVHLSHDGTRVMLLTGPNMAGKSTVMRQVALAVILAQAGGFVPAEVARLSVLDAVMTRIGASDDISEGASTFMVEMRETAAILSHATPRTLVLLDEIGRGTSTWDGLAIAQAVVESLHDDAGALCMFATHYHELTALEGSLSHLHNVHVAVREHGDDIVFVHSLQPGPTNRSHGITVARLAGLPESVIDQARGVLSELERGARTVPSGQPPQQLSFFDSPPSPAPRIAPESIALIEDLRTLDPDTLTPRAALDLLYRLHAQAQKTATS